MPHYVPLHLLLHGLLKNLFNQYPDSRRMNVHVIVQKVPKSPALAKMLCDILEDSHRDPSNMPH